MKDYSSIIGQNIYIVRRILMYNEYKILLEKARVVDYTEGFLIVYLKSIKEICRISIAAKNNIKEVSSRSYMFSFDYNKALKFYNQLKEEKQKPKLDNIKTQLQTYTSSEVFKWSFEEFIFNIKKRFVDNLDKNILSSINNNSIITTSLNSIPNYSYQNNIDFFIDRMMILDKDLINRLKWFYNLSKYISTEELELREIRDSITKNIIIPKNLIPIEFALSLNIKINIGKFFEQPILNCRNYIICVAENKDRKTKFVTQWYKNLNIKSILDIDEKRLEN